MQFDSIAESSYRSFLQYYQAALGNHLSKTPRYVYLFFCFSVYISFTVHLCIFPDKIPKTYTVLILYWFFCTIFSLKHIYSWMLNKIIIQSGLMLMYTDWVQATQQLAWDPTCFSNCQPVYHSPSKNKQSFKLRSIQGVYFVSCKQGLTH